MYSESALKLYSLKKEGIVRSNAAFWRDHDKILQTAEFDLRSHARELDKNGINLLCAFDEAFPHCTLSLCAGEKPYLFAYRGDISLLKEIAHNIAVVGVLNPSEEIIAREKKVVAALAQKDFVIVSGLARGCDTVAHRECLACGGKTVAFLPTTISNIYPKENAALAEKIAESGGLVPRQTAGDVFQPHYSDRKLSEGSGRQRLPPCHGEGEGIRTGTLRHVPRGRYRQSAIRSQPTNFTGRRNRYHRKNARKVLKKCPKKKCQKGRYSG